MTRERDPLDLEGFDLDLIGFKIDLEPAGFDVPNLELDLDSLYEFLNFNFDSISEDLGVGSFLSPKNARDGVLLADGNSLPSLRARDKGSYRQKCGAMTRKGTPCRCKPLPGKRRCKFHGGLSTGPKTSEGRERIAEAQRRRWASWRIKGRSNSDHAHAKLRETRG